MTTTQQSRWRPATLLLIMGGELVTSRNGVTLLRERSVSKGLVLLRAARFECLWILTQILLR